MTRIMAPPSFLHTIHSEGYSWKILETLFQNLTAEENDYGLFLLDSANTQKPNNEVTNLHTTIMEQIINHLSSVPFKFTWFNVM
jgi:hypothetical protein